MNRRGLLAIVVCVSACDIVGNVPDNVPASVTLFEKGCTGTSPTFALYLKVDAMMASFDRLDISWDIPSSSGSGVTFTPQIDCGWWTAGLVDSRGVVLERSTDADPAVAAFCIRDDAPPRQIVTVRGTATMLRGMQNEQIFPDFSAQVESDGGRIHSDPDCSGAN